MGELEKTKYENTSRTKAKAKKQKQLQHQNNKLKIRRNLYLVVQLNYVENTKTSNGTAIAKEKRKENT